MTTSDRPRLIEVAFPLERASLDSVHEKNVRARAYLYAPHLARQETDGGMSGGTDCHAAA